MPTLTLYPNADESVTMSQYGSGTGNYGRINETTVYASVHGGDIYKQTGGTGVFAALKQTSRDWRGMAAAPNGDVYACVLGGGIYKQTGGAGNFVALGQTSRQWIGLAAAPNGDVYASVHNGDIYKQTGGVGNFAALSQTTRIWRAMAVAPNGDVYACVYDGDIYKQTGGVGNFVALSQTSRYWRGMAASPNGDVYASVYGGDIYKQSGGAGAFVALEQTSRYWHSMAASPNGDVYACVYNGDIYKQTGGTGDFEALEQTTRDWRGMAASQDDTNGVTTSSTSGQVDLYGLPDPSQSGTINSVTVHFRAKWDYTGTLINQSYATPLVRIGGTTYSATAQGLTNTFQGYSRAWSTNPNTESAWTWQNINDLIVGLRMNAGTYGDPKNPTTGAAYCSSLYVIVDYTEPLPVHLFFQGVR